MIIVAVFTNYKSYRYDRKFLVELGEGSLTKPFYLVFKEVG